MCEYVSFSHKITEITRRRRLIIDSQSRVQSPLRQFSDGAIKYKQMPRLFNHGPSSGHMERRLTI